MPDRSKLVDHMIVFGVDDMVLGPTSTSLLVLYIIFCRSRSYRLLYFSWESCHQGSSSRRQRIRRFQDPESL